MNTKTLNPVDEVVSAFRQHFQSTPALIARAPGRVNLIGEHTDYNDGYVLPIAIDRSTWIAARARTDQHISLHSLDFGVSLDLDLDSLQQSGRGLAEYVKGMAWALQTNGYPITGFDGVIAGNVPIGAGLSSSASLELALALIFSTLAGFAWDRKKMAAIAQQAERGWVGVNCGIMDQLISAAGEEGHALLIDCRSLDVLPVPLPSNTSIVVMDTCTRRGEQGLIDSAYNDRRAQCEEAARVLCVPALRDASLDVLHHHAVQLDPVIFRRAQHVITENQRTLHAYQAMRANDAAALGRLIYESHASLRDDFEVASNVLNTMVDIALQQAGCYGARMTGGGFAGCAIALIGSENAAQFMEQVAHQYERATGIEPELYLCQPSQGASIIAH